MSPELRLHRVWMVKLLIRCYHESQLHTIMWSGIEAIRQLTNCGFTLGMLRRLRLSPTGQLISCLIVVITVLAPFSGREVSC